MREREKKIMMVRLVLTGALASAMCACAADDVARKMVVCSDGTELPGASGTRAPISCAPFPDRLSAFVWRNWFCVDKARLAKAVGATPDELTAMATEMGLPAEPTVLPEWRRTGYITVLRRNWHLLDYDQLLTVLDMTSDELRFKLLEEDFLWIKFGFVKPRCGALVYDADAVVRTREARLALARVLKDEDALNFDEEPRFTFQKDISRTSQTPLPPVASAKEGQTFAFRMVSPYFADYADPFGDPEVKSCPDGLLEKLAAQSVNAVWFHVVLSTLATDPKYPEFGVGAAARIEALRGLVARAKRYGIDIYLYINEPRAQPLPFFEKPGRAELKGVGGHHKDGRFTMCTSVPETRRWLRDSLAQVFRTVPGLGGVFTITMSENDTSCVSRGHEKDCPRCSRRKPEDVVVEVNRTIEEGVHAGNPEAKVIVWNWAWKEEWSEAAVAGLPRDNVRVMAVSEYRMPYERGGVKGIEDDYSISIVGPGESAKKIWRAAAAHGIGAAAKVQANCTWELCDFPYLPVMDLVAEHAINLRKEGVRDVMMAWSLGGCPSPNLRIFSELRDDDADAGRMLDRIAADEYGTGAVKSVRKAWTAFSDGYREYPFHVGVAYYGPQQWGPANPLYARKTGYGATMVGLPYDGIRGWRQDYPPNVWSAQMQKVADGFAEGSRIFADEVVPAADAAKRAHAAREGAMFRAQTLHFAACADQMRFIVARDAGDRDGMRAAARRELARAKEMLELTRQDSRFGYESSNHYYYIPQDLREKILCCRDVLAGLQSE